ncbi:MAG: helix-turn-helix transcriptional regulator [Bacteroidota bacterium]
MKEEQERLLKYIGEIFEKKRIEKRKVRKDSNDEDKLAAGLYAGFKDDLINAGKRIQKVRESKNMSLAKLAGLTGLTSNYIQEIEIGIADPYMTEMYEITRALEIELSSLFEH